MIPLFKLDQGNDGAVQSARVSIPNCGNQMVRNGSTIAVEIEDGKITLVVYGDINSAVPTHEIDLSGALETARKAVERKVEVPTEVVASTYQAIDVKPMIGIFAKKHK